MSGFSVPAVVLEQIGSLPTLQTVTVTPPARGDVLVRMVASGICHTDISYMRDARVTPVVLGHEGAGIVEQVGEGVTHVQPGDHVVINWQAKCNQCRHCLTGRSDLCENIQTTAGPRVFRGQSPLAVMLNAGTFCNLAVVPAGGAVPIRKDIPLTKAAMLGCAVATGVGAALYTAHIAPGDDVVIIGAGGIGLNIVQGARIANAGQIIVIDLNQARLDLAQQYGATHIFSGQQQDLVSEVRKLTSGRGVDHVFEAVGTPSLMLAGIEMLARGGSLILVGAAARDAVLPFHPRRFMSQQQQIIGCIYGNIRPQVDLPLFADWYAEGKLRLNEMHTASVRLEEVPEVFSSLDKDRGIRPIIEFEA